MNARRVKIGSLCSGYGGLDMATERFFGARPAWFAEYDAAPSRILAHHWPDVPNLGDMTAIDWSAVEPVDIITGGTPCQDLSAAGRRRGMTEGTRSNLWVQMRECIAAVRPSIVIWENVRGAFTAHATSEVESEPGLLGKPYGPGRPALRALHRVLGDLAELGFDARWGLVRASDAGAPHPRARVFVVAADASSVGRGDGGAASLGGVPAAAVPGDLRAAATDSADLGHERGGRARDGRTRSSHDSGATPWGSYRPAIERWERVLGRVAPAPTLPDGKGGAHRLAPEFVEWMMGLPAGHVTDPDIGITRNEQLKALGNGVVPQQAELALRMLVPEMAGSGREDER